MSHSCWQQWHSQRRMKYRLALSSCPPWTPFSFSMIKTPIALFWWSGSADVFLHWKQWCSYRKRRAHCEVCFFTHSSTCRGFTAAFMAGRRLEIWIMISICTAGYFCDLSTSTSINGHQQEHLTSGLKTPSGSSQDNLTSVQPCWLRVTCLWLASPRRKLLQGCTSKQQGCHGH